jgi:hypothetical protein
VPGKAYWKVEQAAVAVAPKSPVAVGGTGVAMDVVGSGWQVGHTGKNPAVAGHAVGGTTPLPGVR